MSENGAPARMRIVILVNPASGRGRAVGVAHAIEVAMRERGADPRTLDVRESKSLEPGAQDAIVVVGGDGSLHHSLDAIIDADTPVRVAPCGTENLFAREFRWTAVVERVVDDVLGGRARRIDVARRDGAPFAVMLSVGPDASIVSRVALARTGVIRHSSYVRPIFAETLEPTLPRISVDVDGRRVVEEARGWLVVANARQYAMRIDPAAGARVDDGLLDVAFMPATSGLDALGWAVRARLRRHARRTGFIARMGREIDIYTYGRPAPLQSDGEAAPPIEPGVPARITIDEGALRVLCGG